MACPLIESTTASATSEPFSEVIASERRIREDELVFPAEEFAPRLALVQDDLRELKASGFAAPVRATRARASA